MSENLKPCPFCGGFVRVIINPATTEHNKELFRTHCYSCKATLPWVDSQEEAQRLWNTRHE